MENEIHIPDPHKMPGGGKLQVVPLTTKELKKKRRKEKKREKKRREKERKNRLKSQARQRQKEREDKAKALETGAVAVPEADGENSNGEKEDEADNIDMPGEDPDELHPLEMPKIDSDNTDSNDEQDNAVNPVARIEDNNLLGDTYFDVKSDHCLMPLLPQQNAYNRNMVLSMGHSGVKFIIEKISKSLESEYKVHEVREKIIQRTEHGEKPAVKID